MTDRLNGELGSPVGPGDHARGAPSARVTLVEYGDYGCPYCAKAHDVVRRLESELASDLCFVFRNLPLPARPGSMAMARLAEGGATLGRFWDIHDTLFERPGEGEVNVLASRLGIDPAELARSASHPTVEARIEADLRSGRDSGVDCAPAFFLNGRRYAGSWDHSTLRGVILYDLRRTVSGPLDLAESGPSTNPDAALEDPLLSVSATSPRRIP